MRRPSLRINNVSSIADGMQPPQPDITGLRGHPAVRRDQPATRCRQWSAAGVRKTRQTSEGQTQSMQASRFRCQCSRSTFDASPVNQRKTTASRLRRYFSACRRAPRSRRRNHLIAQSMRRPLAYIQGQSPAFWNRKQPRPAWPVCFEPPFAAACVSPRTSNSCAVRRVQRRSVCVRPDGQRRRDST